MNVKLDRFSYDGQPEGIFDRMRTDFAWADDFFTWNDEDWTLTGDATIQFGGSAVSGYQIGGWLSLKTASGASDNDEAYMTTTAQLKCDTQRSFAIECRIACVEAATNTANIIFGLINAGAANTLIDDGGGPIVAADKAVFYKTDGTMFWNAQTAKTTGTGTNVQTTLGSAVGTNAVYASSTIYDLIIVFQAPKASGRQGTFHYFVNGIEIATHPVTTGTATTGVTAQPTAILTPILGVKTGSANAQGVLVDWMAVAARR